MRERGSRWAALAAQLGAVWAVGTVAPLLALHAVMVAAFGGGSGPAAIALLVSAVALCAALYAVIAHTRAASALGATAGSRVLWSVLVGAGGSFGWIAGWAFTDAASLGMSGNLAVAAPLGGVAFALAAALLARGWPVRTAALGAVVALLFAGVAGARREPPSDLDARIQRAGLQRELAYAVAVPGYRPIGLDYGDDLGGQEFFPATDPQGAGITLYVTFSRGDVICSDTVECSPDGPGVWYVRRSYQHGYVVERGTVNVSVRAAPTVDKALLRRTTLAARPATDDELLRALPPARTRDNMDRFRDWLRGL
ncbi:hypothetical protein [Dactylosporangium darangshiense]|uniref:Uncharacterized protein n=1 Tax=Dactylosporangium darangshiense TaxID=579108 RepID=A0ABP8DLU8_9ACTN